MVTSGFTMVLSNSSHQTVHNVESDCRFAAMSLQASTLYFQSDESLVGRRE